MCIFKSPPLINKVIEQEELSQKHRLNSLHPTKGGYDTKKIYLIHSLVMLALIPVALIDLFMKRKYKFFFIDLVNSDLIAYLCNNLPYSYSTDRFKRYHSKLFLLPLRFYSHIIRNEWYITSPLLKTTILYFCKKYNVIFFKLMHCKVFLLREDYHAESSLLTSASRHKLVTSICFQHGSMSLVKIDETGIYPGQRANIQITYDIHTNSCFKRHNPFKSLILSSSPPYKFREINYSDKFDIVFVGNCTKEFQNFSLESKSSLEKVNQIRNIYYKPHPSESISKNDKFYKSFKTLNNKSETEIIKNNTPKIFIGITSTLLYDAFFAGYKILLVDIKGSNILDSLDNISSFIKVTNSKNIANLLNIELKRQSIYNENLTVLNYSTLREIIEERPSICQE